MSMPHFRYSLSARGDCVRLARKPEHGAGPSQTVALYREPYPVSIGSDGSAAHSESEAS